MKKYFNLLKKIFYSPFSFFLPSLSRSTSIDELLVLRNLNSEEKRICINAYRGGYVGEKSSQLYIDRWKAFCELEGKLATKEIDEEIASTISKITVTESDLNQFTDQERFDNAVIKLKPVRDEEHFNLQKNFQATELMLERVISNQADCYSKISTMRSDNENLPVVKSFWDSKNGLYIIGGGVAVSESVFTVPALQGRGDDYWLAWATSFALSALIGVSCHFTGEAYIQNSRRRCIAWFGIGIGVIGIITFMRKDVTDNFILSLLNLTIFLAGILLSIRRHKNKYYFDLLHHQDRLDDQENKITDQLKLQNSAIAKIEPKYISLAQVLAKDEKAKLIDNKNKLQTRLTNLNANREGILKAIGEKRIEGVASIQQKFDEGYNERFRKSTKTLNPFPAIALLICLSLSSCSPGKNDSLEMMFIFDRSKSIIASKQFSAEQVYSYITQELIKFDDGDVDRKGIRIYISIVGSSSLPTMVQFELSPDKPYLLRNDKKRKSEIISFKDKLKTEIKNVLDSLPNEAYTNLSRNLCYQLDYLKQSNFSASEKQVFLFSDLIQSSPFITFEILEKNLSFLRTNFEKLSQKLDSDCNLPSLQGVNVNFVYQVPLEIDEVVRECSNFWQKRLELKGARVKRIGNL